MAITATEIQQLYVAYFNRPADALGLPFWLARANASSLATVANEFANSDEYRATYKDMTAAEQVNAIYNNLFGRDAEPAGLLYWAGKLLAGTETFGSIALTIAKAAQNEDRAAIDAKVAASTAFTSALDTTEEIVGYSGDAANAVARAWLSQVVDAATQEAATTEEALGVVIGDAIDAHNDTPGQQVSLTLGADTVTGTNGKDTFTAADVVAGGSTAPSLSIGDKINGGSGVDTLNITQTTAFALPLNVSVTNVENVNLITGTTGSVINTTTWAGVEALSVTGTGAQTVTAAATTDVTVTRTGATNAVAVDGGKNVTVTETGANGGSVTIGATTAAAGNVTVTSTITGAVTGDAIAVTGGKEISVTQVAGNAVNTTSTAGAVTIVGDANTTTVTVTDAAAATASGTVAGHVNGAVSVTDANAASTTDAGKITTVSLNNFGAATVNSGALTTLNLSGTGTSVNAGTLGALATAANTTLAVNTNGLTTTGAVTIDTDITTLNLAGATAASTINSLVAAGVKTLNISGDAAVTLTGQTLGALTDVVVTNSAGASLGTAIAAGVTFTGGAGADSVTLSNAFTKVINMGAGNDTVVYGGAAGTGGSVVGGDGVDTIVLTGAQADAADVDSTFNTKFTGFEVLGIATGATETLNLLGLGNVNQVSTIGANGLTLNNIANNGTLTLTGASTAATVAVRDASFSATDVFNFALSNSGTTQVNFGGVTVAGVETINVSTVDAGKASAATLDSFTLTAADATKIVVTGNNGVDLSASVAAKVTTFDASGVTGNGTADTAANLAVKYTSDNATASANVSITGGAGNDELAGNAAKDTISGGAGDDIITGGTAIDSVTGGAGSDTFVFAAGDAGVTGTDKVTDFNIALGGDKLDLSTATLIADVADVNITASVTGSVDLTATVKNGIVTIGGADASLVDSIGELKLIFEQLEDAAAADVAAFVLNGNTYVITDAIGLAANDIIQLTGVTTATGLSTTDTAGTIWIA
ncbi:DUF4214 domain-containing protein [[Empedobacter] haloabium]|uniref:DUF4214 domain-containing protein n=1 Tax=[Empedobacter] haloabium TaxID=592317 RepID=A0ABZ1UJL0_9BURK